jgi:hypothetical protein
MKAYWPALKDIGWQKKNLLTKVNNLAILMKNSSSRGAGNSKSANFRHLTTPRPPKKYTEMFSAKAETFLANTSDLKTQQKVKKAGIMKNRVAS